MTMRIIQSRSNKWDLEYDNGQRVLSGDFMKEDTGRLVLFIDIANALVELSEPGHAESSGHVSVCDFLDKYTAEHENVDQAGPAGIVRDNPKPDTEPEIPHGRSVIDSGSRMIKWRWAKETIGLATVELNEAYAQFETTCDEVDIPSGKLGRAYRRLEEAMQCLGLADPLGDEIPL